MTNLLTRNDLIGRRILEFRQRQQRNEEFDVDWIEGLIVIDSGIAFRLPESGEQLLEAIEVPLDSMVLDGFPRLNALMQSSIADICWCEKENTVWGMPTYVRTEADEYLSYISSAPPGVGYVGFHVFTAAEMNLKELIPYWNR